MDVDQLAGLVPDGAKLALPPDNSLAPCAFARAASSRASIRSRTTASA